MKICLITPKYPPNVQGGGEISVRLLAEQLASREDIKQVLVISFDGKRIEEINGVRVRRITNYSETPLEISNARVAKKLFEYKDLLRDYDVIHAYNVYFTPAIGVISELLSLPAVATLNSYVLLPRSASGFTPTGARRIYDELFMPTTGRVLRHLSGLVDKLICLSNASKNIYTEYGFEKDNIEVIPNMADPEFNVPQKPSDRQKVRVLYVGTLAEHKGVKYLISAASNLPHNFEIRIVGDGEERVELEKLASETGVETKVEFMGNIPYSDINAEYAKADVFVHPGIWPEPFGRTVIEAMEAGLPVVATNTGGPADIIDSQQLLCPPADALAIADAIKYAHKHQETIGAQNRNRIIEQYSSDYVCSRIINLYEEVSS
ncbi:glycosyltransferase family 4 protein [Natrinema altunense]|uniref:Group 1 glycosyl transferase n=1 Tax=Natrinema altunense (strain JCM 12890 / CGMCC 1.3731 / AJ2) TaxID=1227494 RepID=L9ZM08_NATA2|nr:glycosyltransferase family 4 protein [Natrinema altunense]ELY87076.1 group 1 glycosyl transferase [Natrinema altunense JCM 12890]